MNFRKRYISHLPFPVCFSCDAASPLSCSSTPTEETPAIEKKAKYVMKTFSRYFGMLIWSKFFHTDDPEEAAC